MGNLHIVTGYKGESHVTAADMGSLNAAIFGEGSYVLNRGSKFATTIVSNNKIKVADGDLMIQGRHVRLNEGGYLDMTIENGAQGQHRNDLIVARYTKDNNTGVEDVNLVVIKGTPSASSPVDPEYTVGDIINEHVFLADFPLYRVPLKELNVQELVPMFETASIGAKVLEFTAGIGTSWTGSEAPFTQEVSVPGILATDKPIVDVVLSSGYETAMAEQDAWANIYRIVTAANKITVYSAAATETAINIQMVVNR